MRDLNQIKLLRLLIPIEIGYVYISYLHILSLSLSLFLSIEKL